MAVKTFTLGRALVAAGVTLVFGASVAGAQDPGNTGIARIADGPSAAVASPVSNETYSDGGYSGGGYVSGSVVCDNAYWCESCQQMHHAGQHRGGHGLGHGRLASWWGQHQSYNRHQHLTADQYWHQKLAYFIPTGSGGYGSPVIGHYGRVYAVDPQYFDQRDGQVYAAQGYGVPVAVPLAPTVRHTYNYSWGVPASRLTPVTRIVP